MLCWAVPRRILAGLVGSVLIGLFSGHAALPSPPVMKEQGLWLVAGRDGIFYVGPCNAAWESAEKGASGQKLSLCGWLVGMDYTEATPPKDVWGRSQCGLALITGMTLSDNGRWQGRIYDPRSGRTYQAMLWLAKDGTLRLHGYVGIPLLGQTEIWTRWQGPPIGPECRMKVPSSLP